MRGADEVPPANLVAAARVLAHHSGVDGMVGGQALDLALGQDAHDLTALEQVHALKTGAPLRRRRRRSGPSTPAPTPTPCARSGDVGLQVRHRVPARRRRPRRRPEGPARACWPASTSWSTECDAIAAPLGDKAEPLRAISKWVRDRAHDAAAGVKAD